MLLSRFVGPLCGEPARQPVGMQPEKGRGARGETALSTGPHLPLFPPLCEPTVDFLNFPLMFISPQ